MISPTRRSVLRNSLAVAAAGTFARPFVANAQAKTATVWWTQGFVPEEDAAYRKIVDDYQKQSGNTIDYSIVPFAPLMQKIISAITSSDVPDLISHDVADASILPQNAWDDKVVEVSDVVDTQKDSYSPAVYLASQYYNNATKKRGAYFIPYKTAVLPFHIWNSLVEKAGYKMADAPNTWDAFWDFFKPMQQKLRDTGLRNIYATGLQCTTTGPADGNNMFNHFLIANGGNGIVTKDGKAHLDDPKIKEAVVKSLTYITAAYKGGYVPSGALSWNDADDNNGYHEKLFMMDFDGTLSTELAMFKDKKAFYEDMKTIAPKLKNDGTPMKTQVNAGGGFIPKGAKNSEVSKDFMKYFMQPKVMNDNLKGGLGRWVPAIPQAVKDDSAFWLKSDMPCLLPYVQEAVVNPTLPVFEGYSPAWGQANAEQLWGQAHADVIKSGMKVSDAVDKAFKRANQIFATMVM